MPAKDIRKTKLIRIIELLQNESDERNPLTTSMILTRLANLGIPCESRVLHRDIKALNECGFEIMETFIGHEKGFYIADRTFSIPELKILIDAAQAASFITEKKTSELTKKLAALGGSYRARILRDNIICFNTRKHSNELIYYTVEKLESAIVGKNKITFRYFDLDENKNRVFRRNKELYTMEPLSLIYYEDNYYLMCYNANHKSTCNYRVDRMSDVEISEEKISGEAKEVLKNQDMGDYTEQVFKMYGGERQRVTIKFEKELLGVVYDKFGENISVGKTEDNCYTVNLLIQVSPTFFGWLFQFGTKMQIITPKRLIEEYKRRLKEVWERQ